MLALRSLGEEVERDTPHNSPPVGGSYAGRGGTDPDLSYQNTTTNFVLVIVFWSGIRESNPCLNLARQKAIFNCHLGGSAQMFRKTELLAEEGRIHNKFLERVRGIEPLPQPWEGRVLPLYDTRAKNLP